MIKRFTNLQLLHTNIHAMKSWPYTGRNTYIATMWQ